MINFLDYPFSWGVIYSCFTSFSMAWAERAYKAWFSPDRKKIKRKFIFSLSGQSQCDGCQSSLHPLYLTPMLGYVFSNRRCKHCEHQVSLKYPLNEGLFFLFGYACFALTRDYFTSFYFLLLLIPFYYLIKTEINHKIIPFEVTIYAGIISLAFASYNVYQQNWDIWLVILPTSLWYSLLHLMRILSGYKLGLGDILLCAALLPGIVYPMNLFHPSISAISAIIFYTIIVRPESGEKLAFGPFLYGCAFLSFPFH